MIIIETKGMKSKFYQYIFICSLSILIPPFIVVLIFVGISIAFPRFSFYASTLNVKPTISQVKYPREVLPPALGASIFAIACILSYDGLSCIPPLPDDPPPTIDVDSKGWSIPDNRLKGQSSSTRSIEYLQSLMYDQARIIHPHSRMLRAVTFSNGGPLTAPPNNQAELPSLNPQSQAPPASSNPAPAKKSKKRRRGSGTWKRKSKCIEKPTDIITETKA